jgi:hypothetical protein
MRVIVTGSRWWARHYDKFLQEHTAFLNNDTIEPMRKDREEREKLEAAFGSAIREAMTRCDKEITFVHGDCPNGADNICSNWIKKAIAYVKKSEMAIVIVEEKHPADWVNNNTKAGPMRNTEMVGSGGDFCIAAWYGDVEKSGTFDCMRKCVLARIDVRIVTGAK